MILRIMPRIIVSESLSTNEQSEVFGVFGRKSYCGFSVQQILEERLRAKPAKGRKFRLCDEREN